jgi:hypothetical protein
MNWPLRMSPLAALTLCAIVAWSGCATSQQMPAKESITSGSIIPDPFQDFVALDWQEAGSAWGFPKSVIASWNPTNVQMREAIHSLPDFLEASRRAHGAGSYRNELLQGVIRRLPETFCQGVGVELDGQQAILLNCLPNGGPRAEGWEEHYIRVFDGGPRFWYVVYQMEAERFSQLQIDQGF